MKKTFLLIAVGIACLSNVEGQTSKGNLFFGAGIGTAAYDFGTYTFDYSDNNDKNQYLKNYSLEVSPAFGVFITSHLVFGVDLDLTFTHNRSNFNSSDDIIVNTYSATNGSTFSVGPFMRYYFFTHRHSYSDANTLLYIQAEGGMGSGGGNTYETNYNENNAFSVVSGNTKNLLTYRAGASVGITVFIAEDIGIDVGAGYLYNYESFISNSNTQTTTSKGIVTDSPLSYKAYTPQSELTFSAGVHLFIRP